MMWGYGDGWGMMSGWGWHGPHGSFLWILFLILIVAGFMRVVFAGRHGWHRHGPPPREGRDGPPRGDDGWRGRRSAGLAILDERYAKGEVNREEYLEKRRDLTGEAAV